MVEKNAGRTSPTAKPIYILVLTILMPFGIGYYMSYLFRTVNAIISPQLVSEVGMSPSTLGFMTAAYFITFAAVQLPLGIVLDKFGARRVQAALLMVAAAVQLHGSTSTPCAQPCQDGPRHSPLPIFPSAMRHPVHYDDVRFVRLGSKPTPGSNQSGYERWDPS